MYVCIAAFLNVQVYGTQLQYPLDSNTEHFLMVPAKTLHVLEKMVCFFFFFFGFSKFEVMCNRFLIFFFLTDLYCKQRLDINFFFPYNSFIVL